MASVLTTLGIFRGKNEEESCEERQKEELPALVNVTERNIFSFRVLNNPLNSIPTLQIHREKERKVKNKTKAKPRDWPVNIMVGL